MLGPRLEAEDLLKLDGAAFNARFKVVSKLGQGGFCDVLCVKDAEQQQHHALKVLKANQQLCCAKAGGQQCSHAAAQSPEVSLFREARALKHAKHPNVVSLLSVLHLPKACVADSSTSRSARQKPGSSCWGLMLECLQGGSLQQRIYQAMAQPHSSSYSYTDALTWSVDIASGVAHLHSLNPIIIHRDLKLENILLRKQNARGTTATTATSTSTDTPSRKLPVAKLTDFGLHVMIERPPAPFFISTGEDGMPVLILNPDQQQHHQLALCSAGRAGSETDHAQGQAGVIDGPDVAPRAPLDIGVTASGDSAESADAAARVGPALLQRNSKTALKGTTCTHQLPDAKARHVAFAVAVDAAAGADADAAVGDTIPAAQPQPQPQQQQQPQLKRVSPFGAPEIQQWTRLTARTLRRLSLDSGSVPTAGSERLGSARSTAAGRSTGSDRALVIPLLLESQEGTLRSFVSAAVPADALGAAGESQDCSAAAAGAAAEATGANSSSSSEVGAESEAGPTAAVQGTTGDGTIDSILAAANSQRDYEVNLQAVAVAAQQKLQRSSMASSASASHCPPAHSPVVAAGSPAAAAAGACDGGEAGTPPATSSLYSNSIRSGEWPTAASMMWEDLMEDEAEQGLLLDGALPAVGNGHGGPLIELPLSYNLTGHTGSFMYMAPEVFKRKAYNEAVDVFSLGVILYELFSRTLLIYTHTPANDASDCERYAARVAEGYRPKRPKSIPDEVWRIIEACWQQEPTDRPAASDVLRQLQQLLQQTAAAPKGLAGFSMGKLFGRTRSKAAPGNAAEPAAAQVQAAEAPGQTGHMRVDTTTTTTPASLSPAPAAADGAAVAAAAAADKAWPGSKAIVEAACVTPETTPKKGGRFAQRENPSCGCVIC